MTTVTELLNQTQAELAQAKARIVDLEAALAQCTQTNVELQSMAERYRLLTNSIPDALFVLGLDEADPPMQLLEVNESTCRLLGYSREELLQLTLAAIDDPASAIPKSQIVERLRAGEQVLFEQMHVTRQGRHIPVEIHAQMGTVQGKSVVISLAHDISRRQRVEQELHLFAAVVRQTDDAVVIMDASINQPPTIRFVNDAFTRITGYTLQEVLYQKIDILQPSATDLEKRQDLYDLHTRLALGEIYRGKTHGYQKSGTLLTLHWSITPIVEPQGTITHYVAIVRDITAQEEQVAQLQRVKNELQTYQEQLNGILDTMQDALVSLSLPERQLIYVSAAFEKVLGYPSQLFLDDPLFFTKVVHPDDLAISFAAAQTVLRDGFVEFEHRIILPDGQVRWLQRRAWLNYDAHAQPIRLNDSARDITARKNVEEALRQSETYLRSLIDSQAAFNIRVDVAGNIVYCNQRYRQHFSWLAPSPVGLSALQMILPVDHDKVRQVVAQCMMQSGKPVLVELRKPTADGGTMWSLWEFIAVNHQDGTVNEIQCVGFDITQQKQTEFALQEAHDLLEKRVVERTAELEKVNNRLAAIFNHSGDAILLLDIHQGIQQANHAFDTLFALAAESYTGQNLSTFFQSETDLDLEAMVAEVAATHQTRHIEAQAIRTDGKRIDVEISIAPVNRSAQAVTNLVCIIRDITERKQAELVIAEERNLLRTVIDAVPDFIYVKDTQHRMVLNNLAHAHSLGVDTQAAALGKTDFDLFPPAMAAKFYADEAAIFQGGSPLVATEERSLAHNGGEIWALTTKVPLRNLKGEVIGLVGLTHDISSIKATEQALRYHEQQARESQKMLQLVLDTIPVTVFWKDRSSVYLGCNRLFADDAGLQHTADIIGVRDEDLPWSASEASAFQADDRLVMESGQPKLAYEETLLTATGKRLVIQTNKLPLRNEDNTVIGVLGAYIDTTARKEAELALRTSEEKFRQFIESAPIATVITEQGGRIVLVNQQAEKLFGYARPALIGQLVEVLVPDAAQGIHAQYRTDYIAAPEKRRTAVMELAARHKDGTIFPVDLQLSYIDMAPVPLVMSFVIDSTQRKQAEAALKLALVQEKELGELKSRFVSMASHEFRTPLAAILATTETLSYYRAKMTQEQIDSRLDKIRQQVLYMKEIMEDVLQLARMQGGRIEFAPMQGDFAALCREIVEEFESQALYRGRIVYTCATVAVMADFDPRLMRQVINNLLLNALKYSPTEKMVQIELVQDALQVTLRVSDEGIGIPPNDLKHLFEPFHRATNVGTISGTGLGLSIAKQAVDLHKGTLAPVSQVDVGTTFTVVLPKAR